MSGTELAEPLHASEREVKALRRKLERSEKARQLVEERLDKSDLLRKHTIADLEKAREAVELANQELWKRVKERTADLEQANETLRLEVLERKKAEKELQSLNQALVLARDDAVNASKVKSNFLANMSHELRTPLNAVIGYAEILEDDLDDRQSPHLLKDVKKILVAANHQLELINDALDLAKIEAGGMKLHEEDFDLGYFIDELVVTLKPLIERHNNTFHLSVSIGDCIYRADKRKLTQVLFNLISNAAKFTADGDITLRVTTQRTGQHGWLVFSVSDTGIGFDNATVAKLFEPFTQGDSSSTRKYGGTGLGLAITKELVALMGGELDAQGQPGEGATFSVKLAVREDACEACEV